MVLNIVKLVRDFFTSRNKKNEQLNFLELFIFFVCFVPSFMTILLTFYMYTANRVQCPVTFPKYQFRFCECDLLERDFHKFLYIPEYELNRLCVSRYDNDVLYVDSAIQFSNYMQTRNNHKGRGKGLHIHYIHIHCMITTSLDSFRILVSVISCLNSKIQRFKVFFISSKEFKDLLLK